MAPALRESQPLTGPFGPSQPTGGKAGNVTPLIYSSDLIIPGEEEERAGRGARQHPLSLAGKSTGRSCVNSGDLPPLPGGPAARALPAPCLENPGTRPAARSRSA